MRFKVIIFSALVFCFKFVASIPFGNEETIRQGTYQSNNWQEKRNTAEQHGTGFARPQNVPLTNPHQYEGNQEYRANQGRQNSESYGFNHRHGQQHLPLKESQHNFASGTNGHRQDGFPLRGDSYQPGPARVNQQKWHAQNAYFNSAPNTPGNIAAAHHRPMQQQSYHDGGLHKKSIPHAGHQHFKTEDSYPAQRDIHYHPVGEKTGPLYTRHGGHHSGRHTGPVRYENFHEAHSHTKGATGTNEYADNSPYTGSLNAQNEPYNGLPAAKPVFNGAGNNWGRTGYNNGNMYSHGHNLPTNRGMNNGNTGLVEPVASSARQPQPAALELSSIIDTVTNEGAGFEKPVGNSGPDYQVPNAYNTPVATDTLSDKNVKNTYGNNGPMNNYDQGQVAPADTVLPSDFSNIAYNPIPSNNASPLDIETILDKTADTRYVDRPMSHSEPVDTYNGPPVVTNNNNIPLNNGDQGTMSNNYYNRPSHEPIDTADNDNRNPNPGFNNPDTLGDNNPHVYHLSDRDNLKDLFANPVKKNFVLIHANGSYEYIDNFDSSNFPSYVVMNKNKPNSTPPKSAQSPPTAPDQNNAPPNKSDYIISNKTDSLQPSWPEKSNDNDNNQPLGSVYPINNEYDISPPSNDYNSPSSYAKGKNNNRPSESDSNNYNRPSYPDRSNHHPYNAPGSKLHTHISPGIYKSTTAAPDDVILKQFLDSLPDSKNNSSPVKAPGNNEYNLSSVKVTNASNPYNRTGDNYYTTPPPKLHTVISPGIYTSTTQNPEDLLIKNFLQSLSDIPNDNDKNQTASSSNSSSGVYTNPPVESTTDQIITISPIEMATDNVRDGSTPSPNITSYSDVSQYTTTRPQNQKNAGSLDEVLIQLFSNNKTDDTLITIQEIVKNNTKSACNDTLTNTDVPATSDDSSTVATNSTKQNDVDTSDTTSSGGKLLESNSPSSDLKIVLTIPNDSNGTLHINVEVPDSTGNDDTTGDDTLVISIQTSNSTGTSSTTGSKNTDYGNNDGSSTNNADQNKNMLIDLSNAMVVMNRTSDKDCMSQLLSSNSTMNMFIFQMPTPERVLVEKSKETTMYANGTVVEILTQTTWKSKNDKTPTVISEKKIYTV